MSVGKADREMPCPKCGRHSLRRLGEQIVCKFCGYELSPGQEVNFRLFELLGQE